MDRGIGRSSLIRGLVVIPAKAGIADTLEVALAAIAAIAAIAASQVTPVTPELRVTVAILVSPVTAVTAG